MPIPGKLLTTAMAVMPHQDAGQALQLALSMDIPFWPQLPRLNYYEDMYVQASEHFPGIVLDLDKQVVRFSMDKFIEQFEPALELMSQPGTLDVSPDYSVVYPRFLDLDLAQRPAIRGQLEGPVSFGFNILDQDERPIIFDDTIRPFLFDFMAKRANDQLARLKQKNENAFMFIDEPGLQFIFSALSGYSDVAAGADMERFFAAIERPRGVHLCGNPDWDFLLGQDLDILSMDAHTNGEVLGKYGKTIGRFLDKGGILSWGIVPTNLEPFQSESLDSLVAQLEQLWSNLYRAGVDREQLLAQSQISPATCCLVNPDGTATVEKAFSLTTELSRMLRDKFQL